MSYDRRAMPEPETPTVIADPPSDRTSGSHEEGTMAHVGGPPPGNFSPQGIPRAIVLPCALLFGSMFNLTLVVAGLKELIIDELGGTVGDATLFFSIETFAYIIFAPIWGLVSDRTGRRRPFVVLGFAASAAIYALYGLFDEVAPILALRLLQGAFTVMGWSTVMALMLDHPDRGRSGRFMGLMGGSLIFGVAIGAPVGGYLTRWYGPRAPLVGAAVPFALLAIAALFLPETGARSLHTRIRDILGTLKGRPRLVFPFLCHFVDRLAVGLFVVVFPLYLDTLGAADPAIRGRYLSFFLLPFAFLQFFTGRLAERTGPYRPLLLGSLLYGIALSVVGVSGLFVLGPVMFLLGVFASLMFPPAILLAARYSDPTTRGSTMGGFNLAGSLGFAIGPLMGAWAYETRGFAFAFALCGALEILLAVVGWLVVRRWGEDEP